MLTNRGAERIDCDRIAHAVLEAPAATAAVRAAFGGGVIGPDGRPDRPALAEVVFADAAALARLEGIVHPGVRDRVQERLAAMAAPPGERRAVAVIDAAVAEKMALVEAYDRRLFVDASPETRRARAAARGWDAGELERREARQDPLPPKRAAADYVVPNDGDLAEAESHVKRFWSDLVEPLRQG